MINLIEKDVLFGRVMKINEKEAIIQLKDNKVIGLYTDTVMGIGCFYENIDNLYQLKKRDKNKKIIALIYSVEQIPNLDEKIKNKIIKYWPGPVTFIYNDQGYRIPNNKKLLKLLEKIKKPLFVTSANISGEKECINDIQIFEKFKIDCFDNKEKESNIPSTIYLIKDNEFIKIR